MAVDEKYVETVREEGDFDATLALFGIEASKEISGNGIDTNGYTETELRDMYDGDECTGRPVLSDIYTLEFKDKNTGETVIKHKMDLVLFDDTYEDEKEAYIFSINLNSDNIDFDKKIIKNVNSASGLYALAMGFMDLECKGISNAFNKLDVVPYVQLKDIIEGYKSVMVRVVEKQFRDRYYNSFRVVEGEKE
jgi:hypothetical protein